MAVRLYIVYPVKSAIVINPGIYKQKGDFKALAVLLSEFYLLYLSANPRFFVFVFLDSPHSKAHDVSPGVYSCVLTKFSCSISALLTLADLELPGKHPAHELITLIGNSPAAKPTHICAHPILP